MSEIPEALRHLDPEQRGAAQTDGKVLVAANAGAGKSTTLVARTKHLIDRGVNPRRILVSSFNKRAADELQHKINKAAGIESLGVRIGTLHGLFKAAIVKHGSSAERTMFDVRAGLLTGSTTAAAVNRTWRKYYATLGADGKMKEAEAPRVRTMLMYKTLWAGNGISPSEAARLAETPEEHKAATWYEFYEGFKGSLLGWGPSFRGKLDAEREYNSFISKHRQRGRIGDFDDMLSVYLNILERDLEVRKQVQATYDHVMIDECQDLNSVQNRILDLMTEHIGGEGEDCRSYWKVGDPDQCIYEWRGARPDQLIGLDGKKGWTTRLISTNYRCPPEVVLAANRLIGHNKVRMSKTVVVDPTRRHNACSIKASLFPDEALTAVAVVSEIQSNCEDLGFEFLDHAVLCRTNKELNTYETALLLRGLPYARRGSSSFLDSVETRAFLGYLALAMGDKSQAQQALKAVLNKPNRFFIGPDQGDRAVNEACTAHIKRVGKKDLNLIAALKEPAFQADLVSGIVGSNAKPFRRRKVLERVREFVNALGAARRLVKNGASTLELFEEILDMPGIRLMSDPNTGKILGEAKVTFHEELNASVRDFGDEGDAASEIDEDEGEETLGNVAFLFELAKTNLDDPDEVANPPTTPDGFWAKLERLRERAEELRIDVGAWEKAQAELPPDERKPPPGVYLGTAHSVKGGEWPNVYVQMPRGKFPLEPRKKAAREINLESERRLAYVAITRPSKNLHIVAPRLYQGEPAGMSPFLDEAGLVLGENVKCKL